ncbi:dnaJ homolog subfamily C member 21 [Leptinotarsa decemlineata]|uniref:dnaJ homolog subfamily C member 21 n=1 Tax=Leptinotarsa decemlineata TaxID=7539 RepID=UPI003D30A47B
MKCHYEVLDISRDADDAEIKSAYRKLALKWHPDKNLDNAELAKEQFQIVQQAYEILSDRQERAWYDNHREQILRGSNSAFEDKSLDVFQYFTTTCFKGYGDDKNGFYSVYRNVFDKIAKEDMEFMEDKEEFCEIPSFGNSSTDYEKVSEFYAYWLNYLTKKSYVWLDPYDIKDIRDRRYLKLVEKENKKVRQKARKERNEEVQNLVAFVRKRDKRVQAQKKLQEQKLAEDKKKRDEMSKQKRLERQQELNQSINQPEWAKFDNVKSELEEIEKSLVKEFGEEFSNSECEDDEEDFNNLYCVACNKVFKTPKAFENHESSKKHKENVELLKESMLDEELASNPSEGSKEGIEKDLEDIEEEIVQDIVLSDSDSLEDVIKTKKKKKKARNILVLSDEETLPISISETNNNSDEDFSSSKKSRNKKKKNNAKIKEEETDECNEIVAETVENEASTSESTLIRSSKKEKRKDKKNRKEAPSRSDLQELDTDHSCVTCKSNFPSKNKLFDHLKKTGHGVYIPSNLKSKNKKSLREK